ncbi:adenylate/guanylate cyclase domain-containing protein [Gordonia crocea]|uniref:Adenylate/guanylate cyclase domain-containing protein n=1 Tax=Gordonia crocea TaxID=589162 RepID=A0A7M3STT6_9ACTN|nr:adenylate/guanylate cyclase domain-containing protein [Gordonia crocea]GED96060.1 adenylate/guanylate cyclase domain-containing protein [Gordonia crocea]
MTDEQRYSRAELTAVLGVSPEQVDRLWNAFGFARRQTDAKIFSQHDLDALRLFVVASRVIPDDEQVATARAIGQSAARLADWQADMLLDLDRNPAITWSIDDMARAMSTIQTMVWRRHLEAALERDVAQVDPTAAESQRLAGVRTTEVVGFADIVGFTSLSRRIDLPDLEVLLEAFENRVHAVITAHGGQVVKTLGDAVLFTNTDVASAASTAVQIQEEVADVDPVPPLRIGLAYGEILNRHGDVFGEPVNIASRLCGSARPGTTLIDAALAEAIGRDEGQGLRIRPIPTLSVRGYRRLKASTLTQARPARD